MEADQSNLLLLLYCCFNEWLHCVVPGIELLCRQCFYFYEMCGGEKMSSTTTGCIRHTHTHTHIPRKKKNPEASRFFSPSLSLSFITHTECPINIGQRTQQQQQQDRKNFLQQKSKRIKKTNEKIDPFRKRAELRPK